MTDTNAKFSVDPKSLGDYLEKKQLLLEYEGIDGLCSLLHTSLTDGLSSDSQQLKERREYFGENFIPPKLPHSFFYYFIKAFQDYMLIILLFGGLFFIIVETIRLPGTVPIDGIAIMVSVFIVVLVVSINDYTKELKFKNLHKTIKMGNMCTVIRDGQISEINTVNLVVGDIYLPKYGDLIPADCVLFQQDGIKTEESALTGESDLVKKTLDKDPYLLASTHVMDGSGKAIVIGTGHNSQTGRILRLLDASKKKSKFHKIGKKTDQPPEQAEESSRKGRSILQEKLNRLALLIGKIGITAGVLVFIIRSLVFCIQVYTGDNSRGFKTEDIWKFLDYILEAFAVIIVAVPEGLPLAVTISLAYSVMRMLKDKNLVRQLFSCETMGNATTVCSDKTGTLTMNRMTVIQICIMNEKIINFSQLENLPPTLVQYLCMNICFNKSPSSSLVSSIPGAPPVQVGNKTDCALLGFLSHLNIDYSEFVSNYSDDSIIKTFPFNSEKKMMSIVMRLTSEKWIVLAKGAPDVLLAKCKHTLSNSDGSLEELTETVLIKLQKFLSEMATDALRTILLAYKEIPPQNNVESLDEAPLTSELALLAIAGIEDPVRPEVPDAIRTCYRAGITVRMVTGDNLVTARSIAMKCGILSLNKTELVMDSARFNTLIKNKDGQVDQDLFDKVWPHLRVLARSSPRDKYVLVDGIINTKLRNKQIVAVTGDGTNDAPALKRADVGFAMGLTGTDVAKEACDIIITDDSFANIVKAILWGRNVYDSISKFLQFQLSVNAIAIAITLLTTIVRFSSTFKPIMFLWINLIMDSFASLALATEMPNERQLDRKPYSPNRSLLSKCVSVFILFHGLYQFIILSLLVFLSRYFFSIDDGFDLKSYTVKQNLPEEDTVHLTLIFTSFVFMQAFNLINSRRVHGERNVFEDILKNKLFLIIFVGILISQILIVQFTNGFFHVCPLNIEQWMWVLFIGLSVLPYHQLVVVYLSRHIFIPKRYRISQGIPSSSVICQEPRTFDARVLWFRGLHKLQQELRVLEAFKQNLTFSNPSSLELHKFTSRKILDSENNI